MALYQCMQHSQTPSQGWDIARIVHRGRNQLPPSTSAAAHQPRRRRAGRGLGTPPRRLWGAVGASPLCGGVSGEQVEETDDIEEEGEEEEEEGGSIHGMGLTLASASTAEVSPPRTHLSGCGSDDGDSHEDACHACGEAGELLMCDGCPKAFHLECVGLAAVPAGDWYCRTCRGRRRAC